MQQVQIARLITRCPVEATVSPSGATTGFTSPYNMEGGGVVSFRRTKSLPRHSNDIALAEAKNGAVIRKHVGYRKANEEYDPQAVGAWFIRKGMDGKHATAIAAIATDPSAFRASRGEKNWGKDDIKRWREEAVKS